jgi:SAM-dependent methyltransferase
VLAEVASFPDPPSILDIGCGSGFDDDPELQRKILEAAGEYVGVDPDVDDRPACIKSTLEEAPLDPESVDLAFAIMVLEHVTDPGRFWSKIHSVLRFNGVFWAFTVDSRHWFRYASTWSERLHVKDLYLTLLRGRRGVDRYGNYRTCYRTNSPTQVESFTGQFRSVEFVNFQKIGQVDYYFPRLLRPIGHAIDRAESLLGLPGMLLGIRAAK